MARYPEVPMPERPRGTTEQKIDRIYTNQWQLAELLNNIINILNKEASKNGENRSD